MFKKHKKLKFLLPLLSAVCVFSLLQIKPAQTNNSELASLNSKYGLVGVEALSETPYLSAFHPKGGLEAKLLNKTLPEKGVIVKLNNKSSQKELQDVFVLNLRSTEEAERIAQSYENLDLVQYAEPNFTVEIAGSAETESEEAKSNLDKKSIESETVNKVIVAVIDSGADLEHPDLKNVVTTGRSFIDNAEKVADPVGHGTHISGIIAANSPAAEIMALQFTDGKTGKLSKLLQAIKFAADNGAQVINLSLGLKEKPKSLEEAIRYAQDQGIIVVAATGNHKSNTPYYPAAFDLPNVIAVSALDKNQQKLFLSNFGEWVDFSADGQDIYSTFPGNSYAYRTGTSQAAAFVTALVTNILSQSGNSFSTIYQELEKISEPIEGEFAALLGRRITTSLKDYQ